MPRITITKSDLRLILLAIRKLQVAPSASREAAAWANSGKRRPPAVNQSNSSQVQEELENVLRKHAPNIDPIALKKLSNDIEKIIWEASQPKTATVKPLTDEELNRLITSIITVQIATLTFDTVGKKEEIFVIGFGNMAEAIVASLNATVEATVNDLHKKRSNKISDVSFFSKKQALAEYSNIFSKAHGNVLLSVKPQKLGDVADDLRSLQLKPESAVFSVLAGISTDILKSLLPSETPVVRTMPNTPMSIGYGVTGVYLPKELMSKEADAVRYFGTGNNKIVFVENESQINYVTAISGSGPAYFFLLAELIHNENPQISEKNVFELMDEVCSKIDLETFQSKNFWKGNLQTMVKQACGSEDGIKDLLSSFTQSLYRKAKEFGFSPQDADTLARHTAIGASKYGFNDKKTAQELRVAVTSPGGTTAEALKIFGGVEIEGKKWPGVYFGSLDELVGNAAQAASGKAVALGKAAEEKFLKKTISCAPKDNAKLAGSVFGISTSI